MTNLFRNSSPGAMTREQAVALGEKCLEEHQRQMQQARELAAQGRGEDTEIAHVARGEFVVPRALQTPEVLIALRHAAAVQNIPLERYRIGNTKNSINPDTGLPEFGVIDALGNWGIKAVGRIAEPFEKENSVAVVRPIETAPDLRPSDSSLNYDPNGPNQWSATWHDPSGAISAGWHAIRAKQEAIDRFDDDFYRSSLQGGEGDAWRHARWSQRLANSIGAERAKAFTDAHERGEPNPFGSRTMDLYNNSQGRSLEGDNTKASVDNLLYNRYLRKSIY